jgi:hypothetical protein
MLFRHAQGCELRSTLRSGIRSPDEPDPGPKKWSAGRLLDRAIADAGLDRRAIFVTNEAATR